MFGEVAKLFDRNFAVGYLLPVALFLAVILGQGDQIGLINTPNSYSTRTTTAFTLEGLTIVGLLIWLGSVLLLILNRSLIRLLEGYPFYYLVSIAREQHRFDKLHEQIEAKYKVEDVANQTGAPLPVGHQIQKTKLQRQAAEQFPDHRDLVLPTAFGNAVRAFEVYPRVMYGVEAVTAWDRLVCVMPKEAQEQVNNAKSYVDFWINIWMLSGIAVITSLTIISVTLNPWNTWQALSSVLVMGFALYQARQSAIGWGDAVRSAFDLFLPSLAKQLGFTPLPSREAERERWTAWSQAITFRRDDVLYPYTAPTPENRIVPTLNQNSNTPNYRPSTPEQ